MPVVDIVIIILAILFALHGWRSGFVRSAGSLVAFVASIVGSLYLMGVAHDTFGISFTEHPWLTMIAFLLVLTIANQLAGYLVDTLDMIRKVIAIVPLVNFVNSSLGAIFGLLQVSMLVLVFAYFSVTLVPVGDFRNAVVTSEIISRAITLETNAGLL